MKIAIDGRALTTTRTGGGYYTYHLLEKLVERDRDNKYLVCAHKQIGYPIGADNLRVRVDPFPLGMLWQQFGLPRALREEKVDLLHSPLFTLPLRMPCPGIITIFDLTPVLLPQFHHWKVRLSLKFTMKSSAQRASKIIAISQNTYHDIIKHLEVDESKVSVIYPGVSADFHPRDSLDFQEIRQKYANGARYILHVGTLEPRKNLGFLIDVYDRLVKGRESSERIHLVLAGGEGWGHENLFRKVAELGIQDKVFFTGYVPSDGLPYLYNAAEAFVFPSLYEGFGLPVLEAMASGVPVVTSSTSSLPEIVSDGGMVVEGWNVEEWADVLHNVLVDGKIRKDIISRALAQAKKFPWEKCADEMLKVYISCHSPT